MVEVLKKGHAANERVDFTCTDCAAQLRAHKSEGRFEADPRDGNAYVFRCPECEHDNWIAESVVNK